MADRLPIPRPEERPQVVARLRKMVRRWPRVSGYHLNPDEAIVEGIVQSLVRSTMTHGYPFCPCRDLSGDFDKDRANICPCEWHHAEIARDGYCRCVLFVGDDYNPAVAYAAQGAEAMHSKESVRRRDVTIYLTSWCSDCRRTVAQLQNYSLPFKSVDIEQDAAAARQVEAWNGGFRSVPTLDIRLIVTEPRIADLESILLHFGARIRQCRVHVTSWCAHSRRTLAWLQERGLAHTAIDIERDPAAAARVEEWNSGFRSVPTLEIDLLLTEPSPEQLAQALGLG